MKKIFTVSMIIFSIFGLCFELKASSGYNCDLSVSRLIDQIKKIRGRPAVFTRIAPGVLKMEGGIESGTYEEYLDHIDDDITIFVVNSTGGCSNNGVKIGLDILERNLTVIVEGLAASSAANYIFLAGKEKIIKQGFVAFHGNASAFIKSEGWENVKVQLYNSAKEAFFQDDIDFEELFQNFKKETEETIMLEQIFLERINVSQDFFDLTQSYHKGLDKNMDYRFDFLIPSADTLKKWNVSDVTGVSDVSMAEKLGISVIYY